MAQKGGSAALSKQRQGLQARRWPATRRRPTVPLAGDPSEPQRRGVTRGARTTGRRGLMWHPTPPACPAPAPHLHRHRQAAPQARHHRSGVRQDHICGGCRRQRTRAVQLRLRAGACKRERKAAFSASAAAGAEAGHAQRQRPVNPRPSPSLPDVRQPSNDSMHLRRLLRAANHKCQRALCIVGQLVSCLEKKVEPAARLLQREPAWWRTAAPGGLLPRVHHTQLPHRRPSMRTTSVCARVVRTLKWSYPTPHL